MKEKYKKSLRIIKVLQIKNAKQYNKLLAYYELSPVASLKYISGVRNFKDIIILAKET